MHVSYAPDDLVGGVDSQQLALVRRYRRLPATDQLSMLCLSLRVDSLSDGVGMEVLEEEPDGHFGDAISYGVVGYRAPDLDEVDGLGEGLAILDAEKVLAPLAPSLRVELMDTLERIDPFWPTFFENQQID